MEMGRAQAGLVGLEPLWVYLLKEAELAHAPIFVLSSYVAVQKE